MKMADIESSLLHPEKQKAVKKRWVIQDLLDYAIYGWIIWEVLGVLLYWHLRWLGDDHSALFCGTSPPDLLLPTGWWSDCALVMLVFDPLSLAMISISIFAYANYPLPSPSGILLMCLFGE